MTGKGLESLGYNLQDIAEEIRISVKDPSRSPSYGTPVLERSDRQPIEIESVDFDGDKVHLVFSGSIAGKELESITVNGEPLRNLDARVGDEFFTVTGTSPELKDRAEGIRAMRAVVVRGRFKGEPEPFGAHLRKP